MSPSSTAMVHLVPQASHLLLTVKPFCVFFGLSMASPESARAATKNGRLGQPPDPDNGAKSVFPFRIRPFVSHSK